MMQFFAKVKSKENNKLLFWILLGPIFLFMSLLLASIDVNLFRLDLWFVVLLGILLCFLLKKEGLWASLSMLLIAAIFKHTQISSSHFWQIGLEGSIALGFVITALGFDYLSEMVHSFEEKRRSSLENLSLMEEELKKEENYYQNKIKDLEESIDNLNQSAKEKEEKNISYASLIEVLRKNENQNLSDRKNLSQEAIEKEKNVSLLNVQIKELEEKISHFSKENCVEDENKDLLNELNEARKEKQQNHYINEALAFLIAKKTKKQEPVKVVAPQDLIERCENLQKTLKEKNELLCMYTQKHQQTKQTEVLYKQLKKQFEEKKQVLHETRSSLFHMHEKIKAKENEEDLQSYDITEEENILLHDLVKYEEEINQYEKEIEGLYKVIYELSKGSVSNKHKEIIQPELPL